MSEDRATTGMGLIGFILEKVFQSVRHPYLK